MARGRITRASSLPLLDAHPVCSGQIPDHPGDRSLASVDALAASAARSAPGARSSRDRRRTGDFLSCLLRRARCASTALREPTGAMPTFSTRSATICSSSTSRFPAAIATRSSGPTGATQEMAIHRRRLLFRRRVRARRPGRAPSRPEFLELVRSLALPPFRSNRTIGCCGQASGPIAPCTSSHDRLASFHGTAQRQHVPGRCPLSHTIPGRVRRRRSVTPIARAAAVPMDLVPAQGDGIEVSARRGCRR